MSSKINLQTCEYARKSSIFQDNQLIFYKTNKFTYKTSKKLIYNHFHFYCGCSNIIMAIETEMFRLLFLCHERVNLMELYTREKELLIMFGSERRLEFSV